LLQFQFNILLLLGEVLAEEHLAVGAVLADI
jgi:hypothetical protein